jgi:signal transduction histidine kinase
VIDKGHELALASAASASDTLGYNDQKMNPGAEPVPHESHDPTGDARHQATVEALCAEIDERERATAALARRNAELHAELQRRLTESESFSQVLVGLLRKSALKQVLDVVCAQAQSLIGATGSAVLLLSDGAWLEVKHGLGHPQPARTPVAVAGTLAGEVVRRGEAVMVNDMTAFDPSRVCQWPADLTALLTVPLYVEGRVIGVFDVVNKAGGFREDDVPVMSVFANQAAMAIEHTRLQRQAEQLAVLGERERLARELHDSVTQSLYSVTLYANAATLALAAGKTAATAGYLQELQETAQEGMRDMRLLIFQLHPPELEAEGLAAVLQARLAAVEARAGLKTDFRVEAERRLPISIEEELYWIAQEALNNVLKHAKAQHVSVGLRFTDASIRLEVRDDGVGFDAHFAEGQGGVGLRSLGQRAARAGGKLTCESKPGEGTRVSVEVNL